MTGQAPAGARALLSGLVDYAGLFPPARLGMADAVASYATHRRGPAAWMLGRFVVGCDRLEELAEAAAGEWAAAAAHSQWHIAALGTGDPAADAARVSAFNRQFGPRAVVDAFEARVDEPRDVAVLRRALPSELSLACEVALSPRLGEHLAAVREAGAAAKFRLGGLTPAAFPSPASVADAVTGALMAGIPFKATAGLHHPVRRPVALGPEPDAAAVTMHGFVNLFLGAALAYTAWRRTGADGLGPAAREDVVDRLAAVLNDTNAASFVLEDGRVAWRDWALDAEALAVARTQFALSCGSCSFDEPVDDLVALGWLT